VFGGLGFYIVSVVCCGGWLCVAILSYVGVFAGTVWCVVVFCALAIGMCMWQGSVCMLVVCLGFV